jgi:hypothetical protein
LALVGAAADCPCGARLSICTRDRRLRHIVVEGVVEDVVDLVHGPCTTRVLEAAIAVLISQCARTLRTWIEEREVDALPDGETANLPAYDVQR